MKSFGWVVLVCILNVTHARDFVAVSLAMPMDDMVHYLNQAGNDRSVYLRGMPKGKGIDDFYREVLPKLRESGATDEAISRLEVDPRVFDQYAITQVPFFVIHIDGHVYTLQGTVSFDLAESLAKEHHQTIHPKTHP